VPEHSHHHLRQRHPQARVSTCRADTRLKTLDLTKPLLIFHLNKGAASPPQSPLGDHTSLGFPTSLHAHPSPRFYVMVCQPPPALVNMPESVCVRVYVTVCRLTYLNQSISGYLKSPPTKWISLDLLSFMTGICYHQETGGIRRLESLRSVVAGVSGLLRFSVPVCYSALHRVLFC